MCKNTDENKIELLKQKILNEPFKYKDRYKTIQEELDLVINDTILNPIVVTGRKEESAATTETPNEQVCDASQNSTIGDLE